MKIAHIIPDSNKSLLNTFIKFVNENFSSEEHVFYILVGKKQEQSEIKSYKNIKLISSITTRNLLQITKNNDKIIMHSLKLKTLVMFCLLFHPHIFKKIIWLAWGGDLYQWRKKIEGNIFLKIKIILKNKIAFIFRKKNQFFIGIFPPDIEYFKNEFNSNAKTFYASYVASIMSSLYQNQLKKTLLKEKINNNDCINIQIGHSSTMILNHMEVLNDLMKFKDENIKVYVPLSYGDKEYGDKIEYEAKKMFGSKVICLRKMIDKESYYEYLSTIDIIIFNTLRQIGLGNINPMLYMEKKIFMPEDSVMYKFYKEKNIDIWNYNELKKLNYHNFIEPLTIENGRKYIIANELNVEKKIKMWKNVFNT